MVPNKDSIKAIIFDFDGVIVDTFKFHQKQILDYSGVILEDEEYRSLHDGNFFEQVDESVSKIKDIAWENYKTFVHDDMIKLKVEDDIKESLLKLSSKYDLFIVTSGGEINISKLLENNGILGCFKEVLGLESCSTKVEKFNLLFDKYKISKDNSIFITDTLGDLLEANEVQLKSIGVDFGFHAKERLMKGKPVAVVSSFGALMNIFI